MSLTNNALSETPQNSLSISNFLNALKEPIRKTFNDQLFIVYGDVERIVPWKFFLYITLIDKTENQNYSLTVAIDTSKVKSNYPLETKIKLLVFGTVKLVRNEIQLIATKYEDLGFGYLQRQIEEWKIAYDSLIKRVKKELPTVCRKIAVISNPEIQGFEDFTKHLRYGEITVFDTKMQGNTVAESIANTIKKINANFEFDCIAIVRGGGSFIDLFEFNKPILLEIIASSKIPVITAIGHETDFPLCDFVADVRFSTPTDAGRGLSEKIDQLILNTKFCFKTVQTNFSNKIQKAMLITKQLNKEIQTGYENLKRLAEQKEILRKKNRNLLIVAIIVIALLMIIIIRLYIKP